MLIRKEERMGDQSGMLPNTRFEAVYLTTHCALKSVLQLKQITNKKEKT